MEWPGDRSRLCRQTTFDNSFEWRQLGATPTISQAISLFKQFKFAVRTSHPPRMLNGEKPCSFSADHLNYGILIHRRIPDPPFHDRWTANRHLFYRHRFLLQMYSAWAQETRPLMWLSFSVCALSLRCNRFCGAD